MIKLNQRAAIKRVLRSYAGGVCGAASLVIIAAVITIFLNPYHILSAGWIDTTLCIGFTFDAAALYGQRGWDIQTWRGESHAEQCNKFMFKFFASLGIFFTTLGCLLKP